MPIQVRPDGPANARIMIVGEAPGSEEESKGIPFVGASGQELNRMLQEAGIGRNECFLTNVARERPTGNDITQFINGNKKSPGSGWTQLRNRWVTRQIAEGYSLLQKEISMVKPNIIVPVGNVALWALTGKWGISKWRASMMYCDFAQSIKVLPTIHPASVLRQWSDRPIVVQDLRRVKRHAGPDPWPKPKWHFEVRPTFTYCIGILSQLSSRLESGESLRISFDIETRSGHIACAGLAWTYTDALCIPLMCIEKSGGYWSEDQEAEIIHWLWRILTHKRCKVIGQNIIYDSQYTWRHWHFVPNVAHDTMIGQHSIFADMEKGLAFLASMYCEYYYYWKDESKDWDPKVGEEQLWYYNCEDCVYTLECSDVILKTADTLGLRDVHDAQQEMFWPVLRAMQLGVRVDIEKRNKLVMEVSDELRRREEFLIEVLGHPINPRSPQQMQRLFYEDLKQPIIMTRAAKGVPARPTLNDDALQKIATREPILRPLVNCVSDIRTLGVFLGTFLTAPLGEDGRFRCSYNIGGSASGKSAPKTYRMSSSEDAFGGGGNLQNIPSDKSKTVGKAAARAKAASIIDAYKLPNLRDMFIPDPGYVFFNGDLDRADLQVVAWEADDEMLKSALRLGADIHLLNAFILQGKEPPPIEELIESHSKYADHRGPQKLLREFSKVFCHGTNYGGSARTMAANTGRSIQEVERAQKIWFGAHPGIRVWHERVKEQLLKRRFVENKFGYRWYVFDRIDSIIPEAIAWIPQSTVSIVINRIWKAFYRELPEVQTTIMVHDSLAGQIPRHLVQSSVRKMEELARIIVPYDDPLTIPFSIKTSEVSWGDC
ncbi:MAG: DNA polymerase [Candidatus Micrarchaeaceae archaeon]